MVVRRSGRLAPALALVLLAACGGGGGGDDGPSGPATRSLPTPHARFDYQISGAYPPAADVGIVDRDWHDAPAVGKYGVCYVNAFQTQPEEYAFWHRSENGGLILMDGEDEVVDEQWNELVLDTSTADKREAIAAIVGGWIDACAAKGFQAIEPDNLDSWTRSHDLLDQADNVALARLLATRAHADGLAIAQKNTSELAPLHAEIGFDFAVVEECQPFDDCGDFTAAYGTRWIEIEYPDNRDIPDFDGPQNFADACAARGSSISIVYRDRDVVKPGNAAYVNRYCP
jgi:hypothetical protein